MYWPNMSAPIGGESVRGHARGEVISPATKVDRSSPGVVAFAEPGRELGRRSANVCPVSPRPTRARTASNEPASSAFNASESRGGSRMGNGGPRLSWRAQPQGYIGAVPTLHKHGSEERRR